MPLRHRAGVIMIGIPRLPSLTTPARSQESRLTRTTTSFTTALIRLSTRPLTSPESLWNRVISGGEVRILDQCLRDTALNVTLQALFAVTHTITPHRLGPYIRDENSADRAFFASYTMAKNTVTIYDTPTCSPVDGGSRGSLANNRSHHFGTKGKCQHT